MTGAMYASIAGLKTHMQKLSVIGNNVANVNTAGYKTKRTVFRDSMYSMYSSGSNGTEVVGGMNPSQIGYGSLIGSIDLDMSSSSYNPGNPMDCAIVGDGFFLVGDDKEIAKTINPNDPTTFKALSLTRVGDFFFDAQGYLVDGGGKVVYGFMNTNEGVKPDPNNPEKTIPDVSDQLVGIRLPLMEKAYVRKDPNTGAETPASKADAINPDTGKLNQGYKINYTIRYPVTKPTNTTGGGTADANAVIELEDYTPPTDPNAGAPTNTETVELAYAQMDSITIDKKTGAITGITKEGKIPVTIGYLAIGNVTNPNGVSHIGRSYYQCDAGAGDLSITMLGGVNQELGILNVNGSLYRNNNTQGGAADTENELPRKSEVTSAGKAELMTGFLEAPNVDLATEISELITTQRGYQANTRIITVTDSMLEELVNMKR